MTSRRLRLTAAGALVAAAILAAPGLGVPTRASYAARQPALPAELSTQAFARLIDDLSEPGGYFRSDNLVSNEDSFQYIIPGLIDRVKPGGVYIGVGPEQNFTYIAALAPRMAFIVDIRRGNLLQHLMYKALMELSGDRAEFLARLFARPRPASLGPQSTADELFAAFARVAPSEAIYDATVLEIVDHLRRRRRLALSDDDVAGLASVYMRFYDAGPTLAYANTGIGGRGRYPTFRDLQTADDGQGRARAFLATEDAFRFVRSLHQRNLIVPVVGDFAGPKALRAIGAYVRERGATVGTFYLSNVEQYLFGSGVWDAFARNVAALPVDESGTFIRSCFSGCEWARPVPDPAFGRIVQGRAVMLLDSILGLLHDAAEGRIRTYSDVLLRSR
jgi:hypothetical protein